MELLLKLHDRLVYYLSRTYPAVFYLADSEGGGILINSPNFSFALLTQLNAVMPLKFIFYPSYFGATDVGAWRKASGAQTIAYGHETKNINGTIDLVLSREKRFSRTIDFLLMSGRTENSCALRCKNKPGIVFFGPILNRSASGWPTLQSQANDISFENRLIGSLGLKDLHFDYAFTDDFDPQHSFFGPGADVAIGHELSLYLG